MVVFVVDTDAGTIAHRGSHCAERHAKAAKGELTEARRYDNVGVSEVRGFVSAFATPCPRCWPN